MFLVKNELRVFLDLLGLVHIDPLGGSQVPKRAKIDQEIAFHVRNEAKAFVETTFP